MRVSRVRFQLPKTILAALGLLALCGCLSQASHIFGDPSPTASGISQRDLRDPNAECEAANQLDGATLLAIADRIRQDMRPAQLPPKRSILALSGGGSYGAYPAGVLVGWSQLGTRPQFDVVTGISTGALIAPLAFLGPAYDAQIEAMYTQVTNRDLYRIRKSLYTILGEALADNTPLVRRLEDSVTPELLQAIAAEHAKGRRLYAGTTELDSRQQVIWDLGAIATRGTPEDLQLFRDILQASAAIPGFFPPVRIRVCVDGKVYEERHVDGGVTASVFFRPPYVPHELRHEPLMTSLYDADLYVLVAGKTYPDEEPVRPRSIRIVAAGVSTLLYTAARGDLMNLYLATLLTGMNYYIASIPEDFPVENSATEFKPDEMRKLYTEGMRQIQAGTAFQRTPPGLVQNPHLSIRGSTDLDRVGQRGVPRVQDDSSWEFDGIRFTRFRDRLDAPRRTLLDKGGS